MINFNEILKKKAVSKVEMAKKMGIEQPNVNRTLDKFARNLSEIDNFLQMLGTSLEGEMQKETPKTPYSTSLLQEPNNGYMNIPVAVFNVIASQSETILSQQRVIETMSFSSKKSQISIKHGSLSAVAVDDNVIRVKKRLDRSSPFIGIDDEFKFK